MLSLSDRVTSLKRMPDGRMPFPTSARNFLIHLALAPDQKPNLRGYTCYGATYAAAHIPHKILGRGQQTCVNLVPKGQVSGKGENSERQQTKVHNEYPHDVIRY
jgi:uncharacterized protein (DUF1810 family)